MDLKIHRHSDGWISISFLNKTMKVRCTKEEFYSEDINIIVSSTEPVNNKYEDVEVGKAIVPTKNAIDVKAQQKIQRQQRRENELRKEAIRNLHEYLKENNLITWKTIYAKIPNEHWAKGKYKCLKATKRFKESIVKKIVQNDLTHQKNNESINLNPNRRKDCFYIDKDVLTERAKEITKEFMDVTDDDLTVYRYFVEPTILERLEKEERIIVLNEE